MEIVDSERRKKGIKIRLGKLYQKLKRAKRQGDSELQMQVQQNIDELKKEAEELSAFEKANPPGPVEEKKSAPSVGAGLSDDEARLAVNMIVGVENTVLSAVAGQTFRMDIKEDEQRSMEDALKLTASKRLTAEQKGKMDLAFLLMAFLAPLLAAFPRALAAKKMVKAEVSGKVVEEKIEVEKAVETTKPVPIESVAGPMPPPAQ